MAKKSEFGILLTEMINKNKMSQCKFYDELKITKPYFYDIISGKVKPPPKELQIRIIELLSPSKNEIEKLLDCAARMRNELPIDIVMYLESKDKIKKIRENDDYLEIVGGSIKCLKN